MTKPKKSEKRAPKPKEPKPLTCADAGKKGGATTAKRYGKEFYQAIGREGGSRVREAFAALKASKEPKPS